jgi:hypothetical protein
MLPFFRFKRKGSNEERNERTHAARSTKSIDRHAARARTRLLALQLLLADHHAGRELRRRFKSARAQRFHEGTPCCEPPNNSSPAHPRKRTGARAGRSHSRELQTGGSHRETAQSIHTLPRHKAPREEEPKTGVLLGATDRGVKPFPRTERRRDSTRDDAGPTAQRRAAA